MFHVLRRLGWLGVASLKEIKHVTNEKNSVLFIFTFKKKKFC